MKKILSKKGIVRTLITLLFISVFAVSVGFAVLGAQTARRGVTNTVTDYVNMRSGAGTSYQRLTSIPPQTEIPIISQENGDDGFVWYVTEYGGYVGYVRSDLIDLLPDETTSPETVPPGTAGGETTGDITTGDVTTGDVTTGEAATGDVTTGDGATGDITTGDVNTGDVTTGDGTGEEKPPEVPVIDFEEYLTEQGFPEDYKERLRLLHEIYPNWVFKAQHVEMDFEAAVNGQLDRSLVENSMPSSWKSIEGDAYNWVTNQWKIYDGNRWVRASRDIIKHYMDPRNFMGVNSVFQFLDQSYDERVQNIDGVKRIIRGTFMEKDVTDTDGTLLNYAQAIYQAGVDYKVNPYVLASMIVIEVGSEGSSIVSGTVPGYNGLFNYFNIGAYNDGIRDAVARGLWYARGGNNGSTSYLRPWNTRLKAIRGGAYFYSYGYLNAGQNTLYLKRFNVLGEKPFTNQYMTSVYGPAVEGNKLASGYTQELRETALTFSIPIYKNMPESVCLAPTGDGSPNMKLSSLKVENYDLTPEFSADVLEYMLVVPSIANSIKVSAVSMEGSAVIEGLGELILHGENNVFEIKVTAGNGTVRIYKLTVARQSADDFGKVSISEIYPMKDTLLYGISPATTVAQLREKFLIEGKMTVKSASGAEKADGDALVTGDIIKVSTTLNVPYGEYVVCVKGDIDGDGGVTIGDLLKVRNKMLGTGDLSTEQMLCGDIDRDGTITIGDLLKMRNHMLGTSPL